MNATSKTLDTTNIEFLLKIANTNRYAEVGYLKEDIVVNGQFLKKGLLVLFRRYHPNDGYEQLSEWEALKYWQSCTFLGSEKDHPIFFEDGLTKMGDIPSEVIEPLELRKETD
jgi:hypothetical protein